MGLGVGLACAWLRLGFGLALGLACASLDLSFGLASALLRRCLGLDSSWLGLGFGLARAWIGLGLCWHFYEGDHWPIADHFDCWLDNVRPLHADVHRGEERNNLAVRTLPNSSRGATRTRAVLLQSFANVKATSTPKSTCNGNPTARAQPSSTLGEQCFTSSPFTGNIPHSVRPFSDVLR